MNTFESLKGKVVQRLFLIVWPPLGEENRRDVDISLGFVFHQSPDKLCVISTDMGDMYTPCIRIVGMPSKIYPWPAYETRINDWMNSKCNDVIDTEYYEVTQEKLFSGIVSSEVLSIEFIGLEGEAEPFGVRVIFANSYIILSPIADGSTVETPHFNKNDNLLFFKNLGELWYREL